MLLIRSLYFFFLLLPLAQAQSSWETGVGISDITGPSGGIVTMGYADPDHKTMGIHTRLYSRAFVFKLDKQMAAFVSADLGMISESIKLKVVDELQKKYPEKFNDSNVMLTATHTHAGPGGYFNHRLYHFASMGFNKRNFNHIVKGIVDSILQAHDNLSKGRLLFNQGTLKGAQFNQSKIPYLANRDVAHYDTFTNELMTQILLENESKKTLGLVNWFAVHPTNMSKKSQLLSGDSKGVASFKMEEYFKKRGMDHFVAAFANSDEGDISGDIFQKDQALGDLEKTDIVGNKQYKKAIDLYLSTNQELAPVLQMAHAWVKMPGLMIEEQFTEGFGDQKLCPASLGFSFAAGSEDGPSGMPYFYEGMTVNSIKGHKDVFYRGVVKFLSFLVGGIFPKTFEDCHYPKPIFINTGNRDKSWTPVTLPFQILRIGELALLGVPGEITTMASRRLRELVLKELAPLGVEKVVIAGLANSYSEYITTFEEYQLQHYEGASTLFGPFTLAAYRQIFFDLAQELKGKTFEYASARPKPMKFSLTLNSDAKLVSDKRPKNVDFGDVVKKPHEKYLRGERVQVIFQGASPNNGFEAEKKYLEVQKKTGEGKWQTVMTEAHPDLIFNWKKNKPCQDCSQIEVLWNTNSLKEEGFFRLVYNGKVYDGKKKQFISFRGNSLEFEISTLD